LRLRAIALALVHRKGGQYLMKPVDGMWEFPTFPELPAGSFKKIGQYRHTITHHRLDVSVCEGTVEMKNVAWKNIENIPNSSLTRKIWKAASTRPAIYGSGLSTWNR
jgi:adenine-specific DNA glycosylase